MEEAINSSLTKKISHVMYKEQVGIQTMSCDQNMGVWWCRLKVKNFHTDNHTYYARKPFEPSSEILEKLFHDGNITETKAAEDLIIDCVKEEIPSWKDNNKITGASPKKEK